MKKLLLLSLLVVTVLASGFSQSGKIEFEEYDLDNGLHVILQQDHTTPNIVVSVMYHVGSKNENPELTGFAHFFEHLMFEGTKNIPRHQYDKYVSRAGGELNANTSTDRTYYFEMLPSNQLALGLWLESERMLHAKVEEIGIKTQKGVVIQEKKQRYDNPPYGTILPQTMAHAYEKHPYRWTPIGDENHIRNAKNEDFINFYKEFYVPNNAVLTICGDFDKAEAKKLVNDYFAEIPKGTKEIYRPNIVEPKKTAEVRDTVFDNIQLPAVIQAYHIPAVGTKDFYAVDMLSKLMTDGKSSRLYKELVDKQQKAIQLMAFPMPYEDPGLTLAFGIPNMGVDPKALEDEMDKQFAVVRDELISDREFQKLRNKIENELVGSNATIADRAENLATAYTYFKDTERVNKELDKYFAVTKEDIRSVAKKYFVPENRVVLYYLPKQK
ncbi:M16 family metallopeptidase [Marinifilum caeruleilacunae]|uniref:Insulinase family protein n=1 Tax=Marinifilum caeruleilacunae TaxID=2499076 RepID=A0ABX1WU72_9BACT|nr:pitrilysin family protein [Marinifilum caeruleilacunae]NOU59557.1 insulinase family protein [Marinifilum caeruleilacunae]